MKLKSIQISNYRSIDSAGIHIDFPSNYTVFVGENNVGKSTIQKSLKFLFSTSTFEEEDWHKKDSSIPFHCIVRFELDRAQIKGIINIMNFPFKCEKYLESFQSEIEYHCILDASGRLSQKLSMGELFIEIINQQSFCSIIGMEIETALPGESRWNHIIELITNNPTADPTEIISTFIKNNKNMKVLFPKNYGNDILEIIREKLILIEEFRERPMKTISEDSFPITGRDLAGTLHKLRTGSMAQKRVFRLIQTQFSEMFPNLVLETSDLKGQILISIEKEDFDSTTSFIGAGIIEVLILITAILVESDVVIFIDNPELHMHPIVEKKLNEIFRGSQGTQIIAVTHSPYFSEMGREQKIIRCTQKDNHLVLHEPAPNFFSDRDYDNLLHMFDADSREVFFSRKAFLVEGGTEYGSIPLLASKRLNFNFLEQSVTIINCEGKGNLVFFSKICEAYSIPYFILADENAQDEVLEINKSYPGVKSMVLPGNYEDIFDPALLQEAKRKMGRSKVRRGRYIALKIINENHKVPTEIKDIINELNK